MHMKFAALAFAAAFSASPAAAAPLQPAGKWQVEYGETQCVAIREYGPPGSRQVFAIRSAPNGESFEILWLRPGYVGQFAEQLEGTLDFGNGPLKSSILHFSDRKTKTKVAKYRRTAAEMAQARGSGAVRMTMRGEREVELALTQMAAVMAQLDDCTADLRKYWNDAGAGSPPVATPPKERRDMRDLFSSADYPADAVRNMQEGRSRLTLLIDEKGDVASCYVAQPSGVAVIDAMSCQVVVERGRFEPARDSAGKPVRSIYYSPAIQWRIRQ